MMQDEHCVAHLSEARQIRIVISISIRIPMANAIKGMAPKAAWVVH
jgi:hypothetical protein